jgi:hypothetical protein
LAGAIENVHGGAPAAACDTVNVLLAIVSVPLRGGPAFAATANVVDPLPMPEAPVATVIHDALLVAVHRHPSCVVTDTGVPAPPVAATLWLLGAIVYVHAGFPVCVTVARWPPITTPPMRSSLPGATVKFTVAVPVPLAGGDNVIQLTSVVAVHAHSPPVVTVTLAPPPFRPTC